MPARWRGCWRWRSGSCGLRRGLAGSLTRGGQARISPRPDGRTAAAGIFGKRTAVEESPGSTGIRCRLTAGGGDPRESATENKPPAQGGNSPRARVKRCGKSAPRPRQRGRQGKPHREQDRIGAAGGAARGQQVRVRRDAGAFPPRRPGWSREARREARPRGMAVPAARLDRTRLTGRLAPFDMSLECHTVAQAADGTKHEHRLSTTLAHAWSHCVEPHAENPCRGVQVEANPFDAHTDPWYPMMSQG